MSYPTNNKRRLGGIVLVGALFGGTFRLGHVKQRKRATRSGQAFGPSWKPAAGQILGSRVVLDPFWPAVFLPNKTVNPWNRLTRTTLHPIPSMECRRRPSLDRPWRPCRCRRLSLFFNTIATTTTTNSPVLLFHHDHRVVLLFC